MEFLKYDKKLDLLLRCKEAHSPSVRQSDYVTMKGEWQRKSLEIQKAFDMTASSFPAYKQCNKLKQDHDNVNHKQ